MGKDQVNRMKKDVMISIRGLQKYDGVDQDSVELVTPGILSTVAGGYNLSYQETEITGLEGTVTSFQVFPEQVSMVRMGTVCLQMVFQQGRRHYSVYETPYGSMSVGVRTERMHNTLGEAGGEIDIKYAIEIDHAMAGSNEFHINVREVGGGAATPCSAVPQ